MSTLRLPPVSGPSEASASPPESSVLDRERQALGDLTRLVAERAAAESELERVTTTANASADRDYQERRKALDDRNRGSDGDRDPGG